MLRYTYIYKLYFSKVREKYNKRELKETTIHKRMSKIIDSMSIQDRYYIQLLDTYHMSTKVAAMADVTTRKASSNIEIALNKLISPKNVVYVTGLDLFTHTGDRVSTANILTTRTINALKKSGIETLNDLRSWLKIDILNIYHIPGVGKAGQAQILKYLASELIKDF